MNIIRYKRKSNFKYRNLVTRLRIDVTKQSGRTNFSKMVKFFQDNPDVKILLCEKTDRLYRNFKDYVIIDDLDLTLIFVKEGSILNKYSKSHEKFIHGIKVLMAKNYIDNLSEETRKGMLEKAEEGEYPSYAPLGYLHDKINKKIKIDKTRAKYIKELFELYATGNYSIRQLENLMYKKGLRTRKNKKVVRSSINEILKNPFYYGYFYWSGKLYKGKHQPIISKDLFDKVQIVIHRYKNTRAQKRGFAYAGLLVCGKCGSSITAEIKKEKYIYYHCTFNKGKCDNLYIREEDLEKEFERIFKKLKFNDVILEWIKEGLKLSLKEKEEFHNSQIKRLNDEYLKLENRINQMYIDKLDGEISEEFYRKNVSIWRERQEKILKLIKEHQQANENYLNEGIKLIELANNSYEYFKSKDKIERAILIKMIMKGSKLVDGKIEPIFSPPFDIIYQMSKESQKIRVEEVMLLKTTKAGKKIISPAMSKMLPLLDNFRTYCYENKIDDIPDCLKK